MKKLIKITDTGLLKFGSLDAVAGNSLADMLEVPHKEILKTIKRTIKQEEQRKKQGDSNTLVFSSVFKEWEFKNKMNRTYKTFIMNEDALYLVIANTQSKKAHELKVWFKSEFNKMRIEKEIREQIKQPTLTTNDALKLLADRLLIELPTSSKHSRLYLHTQSAINGVVSGKNKKLNRDMLTTYELTLLNKLENIVSYFVDLMLEDFGAAATRLHVLNAMKCLKVDLRGLEHYK